MTGGWMSDPCEIEHREISGFGCGVTNASAKRKIAATAIIAIDAIAASRVQTIASQSNSERIHFLVYLYRYRSNSESASQTMNEIRVEKHGMSSRGDTVMWHI